MYRITSLLISSYKRVGLKERFLLARKLKIKGLKLIYENQFSRNDIGEVILLSILRAIMPCRKVRREKRKCTYTQVFESAIKDTISLWA